MGAAPACSSGAVWKVDRISHSTLDLPESLPWLGWINLYLVLCKSEKKKQTEKQGSQPVPFSPMLIVCPNSSSVIQSPKETSNPVLLDDAWELYQTFGGG